MTATRQLLATARMLASRLERLSADSGWAHRASGLRGSLLRTMEQAQTCSSNPEQLDETTRKLEDLLRQGFAILEHAAREIPSPQDDR